jgi:hypothetical protein
LSDTSFRFVGTPKNFENGLCVKGCGSRELSLTRIWDP